MSERLFTRGPLSAAVIVLLVTGGLALWHRDKVAEWSDWAANVATVLGLLVSMIGFALTILTMLDTQQISREAQRRIEEAGRHTQEAVERAQQETRQAIQSIGVQLRSADCGALGRWVRDLRQAAFDAQWHRALYRAQEGQWLALRLSHDKSLLREEIEELRAAAERLLEIQRFIEKNRLPDQPGGLNSAQIGHLDNFIRLPGIIEGRLLHQSMG